MKAVTSPSPAFALEPQGDVDEDMMELGMAHVAQRLHWHVQRNSKLEHQCGELLAALEQYLLLSTSYDLSDDHQGFAEMDTMARGLIAKIKRGA